jgi:hypothetical protein
MSVFEFMPGTLAAQLARVVTRTFDLRVIRTYDTQGDPEADDDRGKAR